jgi:sialate O-acetylesterase
LREAQSLALKLPNTGQAVTIDIGETGDIHPRNKKDVGERLALIALAKDYGKAVPFSGPVYDSMKIESGKAILSFLHTEGGLLAKPLPETCIVKSLKNETAPLVRNSPSSQLEGFAICGEDRQWVWADAKIDGNNVIVWSDKVPSPVAVRYAWADNPTCNLTNGAGLPASPFRTDDFPPVTLKGKY